VVLDIPGDLLVSFINLGCAALKQHFEVLRVNVEVVIANFDYFFLLVIQSLKFPELSSQTINSLTNALLLLFGKLETVILLGSKLRLLDRVAGGIRYIIANVREPS